jgi:hypothetical protein
VDAREDIEAIRKLGKGKRLPVLVDIREVRSADRDARAYFGGAEAARVELAAAILVGSPLSRMIGNFYLTVSAPLIPTRLFASYAEAIAWL